MKITKLDHVNIRTQQLDKMIEWYTTILGLHQGKRPSSRSQGAWMYIDDSPVVHLVEIDHDEAVGSEVELKLEHVGFVASGFQTFEDRLRSADIPFRRSELTAIDITRFNVWDPDGNHVHIDFKVNE